MQQRSPRYVRDLRGLGSGASTSLIRGRVERPDSSGGRSAKHCHHPTVRGFFRRAWLMPATAVRTAAAVASAVVCAASLLGGKGKKHGGTHPVGMCPPHSAIGDSAGALPSRNDRAGSGGYWCGVFRAPSDPGRPRSLRQSPGVHRQAKSLPAPPEPPGQSAKAPAVRLLRARRSVPHRWKRCAS